MNVLAVSPESDYAGEAACVVRLLENGLARYHLRKPGWAAGQTAEFIRQLPKDLQPRISLHQHHELAGDFPVGLHFRDSGAWDLPEASAESLSRSLHRPAGLAEACQGMDYVFLSPVFSSISKPGYAPDWSLDELQAALPVLCPAAVYALGGIDPGNYSQAMELGFDGVVLHGALWGADDPVEMLAQFGRVAA